MAKMEPIYPLGGLEIDESFFASLHDYRARNGYTKCALDMRKSINACCISHKPKHFIKRRRIENDIIIGFDVVRVE